MLTQGPAPDPKNFSSFPTLPHSSVSLICAKEIMIIVLLLQILNGIKVQVFFGKNLEKMLLDRHDKNYYYFGSQMFL